MIPELGSFSPAKDFADAFVAGPGFFYYRPERDVDQILHLASRFFDSKSSYKNQWPLDASLTGYSTDAENFHDPEIRDLKETFDINKQEQWPSQSVPSLMDRADSSMRNLAMEVSWNLFSGLGDTSLQHIYFSDDQRGMMRAIRYPGEADTGIGSHTDYGFLTLIIQDQVGGLEIFYQNEWHPVEPRPGTLVVNSGELLEVLTNGAIKPTLHRVRGQNKPRDSLVFFHNPGWDCVVRPMVSKGEVCKYDPVTTRDHITRRYNETYLVRKNT